MAVAPIPLERVGPYRVDHLLGEGGAGLVYRAVHATTGNPVALKTLRGLEPEFLEALRREIHTLSRLRHPGIVRIVEHGLAEGVPWYAMEILEGKTLDRSWTPDAWRPSLGILERLCHTLAFLHGEGIVHRDLKPANILVRPGGDPVLVDFGLVSRFGGMMSREALEVGGSLSGTVGYMAPEQIRGEYVDARADLYALGCLLYEATTGRPPFVGSGADVAEQHLEERPRPPAERRPDLPPELDALILRLLEKQPRRRPGYATDVALALASFVPADDAAPRPPPRPYLYRASFVGRRDALAQVRAVLGRVASGGGETLLVAGESGAGKTRLALEVIREASARGFAVVAGECQPVEARAWGAAVTGAPLHPLRPLLRAIADHCLRHGAAETARILGRRAAVLGPYEPSLAALAARAGLPEPEPLAPQAVRERLLADLSETVAAFAGRDRLLLVIDDLQWADEMTLAFLAGVATFQETTHLLVFGTYRSEEETDAVRALNGGPRASVLRLARMDVGTVGEMVSEMLALEPTPWPLIRFLARVSEGNPFFVGEYLHAAVGASLLGRTERGEWRVAASALEDSAYESLPLPHTIRDLVERRLQDLSPAAHFCLEAAAVLGRRFLAEEDAILAGLSDAATLEAISELLARDLIEDVGSGQLQFTHDKLREVGYERIAPERRIALHRAAALAIESRHAADADFAQRYGELAHHWSQARVDEKALDYLGKAGAHALQIGAPGEARDLLTRALELVDGGRAPAPDHQRGSLLRMLGEACVGTGDLEASIAPTSAALTTAGVRVPTTEASWVGLLVVELARRAVPRLSRTADDRWMEAVRASGQLATTCYFRFDLLRGVIHSLRCVRLAERAGVPALAALSLAQLGYVAGGLRLHRLANRCFRRAYAHRAQGGHLSAVAAGLYFHAMYEMGVGHWEASERRGREALALLEEIGDRQEAEVARTVIANTLYFAGRFRESAACCQAVLESARARSNVQHVGWGQFLTGRVLLALGEPQEAVELLARGREALIRVSDFVSLVMCEGLLAKALLTVGQQDRSIEVADGLSERIRARGIVPLAQCLDGYAALADVYLRLWRERRGGREAGAARRACGDLRRFARIYPIARPAALRSLAWRSWLAGQRVRALRLWERSVRAAVDLHMPYDEARAQQMLARVTPDPVRRDRYATQAAALIARLGCAGETLDP